METINDNTIEGPEIFSVILLDPYGGLTLGNNDVAVVTIEDNEPGKN